MELLSLTTLLDRISDFVRDEIARFSKELDQRFKEERLDEEQAVGLYEAHAEEFDVFHSFFPNAVRQSILTLACSLFESRLMEACKYLEDSGNVCVNLPWASFAKDSGIKRSASFLKKNFKIHPEDHPTWSKIVDVYSIRNCFIHAHGNIKLMKADQQQELKDALKRLSQYEIIETDGNIVTSESFLRFVMDDMKAWFEGFEKACKENNLIGPEYWP